MDNLVTLCVHDIRNVKTFSTPSQVVLLQTHFFLVTSLHSHTFLYFAILCSQ